MKTLFFLGVLACVSAFSVATTSVYAGQVQAMHVVNQTGQAVQYHVLNNPGSFVGLPANPLSVGVKDTFTQKWYGGYGSDVSFSVNGQSLCQVHMWVFQDCFRGVCLWFEKGSANSSNCAVEPDANDPGATLTLQ